MVLKRCVCVLGCALLLSPAAPAKNKARDVWKRLLGSCAENDLLGGKVLYFGPSNEVGVGAILRKTSKGYGLRYRAADLHVPPSVKIVTRGRAVNCSVASTGTFQVGGGADARDAVFPLAASSAAQLARARNMSIAIKGYRWDTLVEGVFENWFRKKADPSIQEDVYSNARRKGERLIVTKALWLSGFSAVMSFDSSTAAGVRAALPAGILPASRLGFAANLKWRNNETLVIETTQPFFIGGEISEFTPSGIRGEEGVAPPGGPFTLKSVTGLDEASAILREEREDE